MNLAHAYAEVLRGMADKESVKRVIEYMKARGHLSLLPQIVRLLERYPSTKGASVTVARDSDVKKFEKDIRTAVKEVGESDFSAAVDPTLVGGFTVRGRSLAVDRSYRKALVSIYQNTIR